MPTEVVARVDKLAVVVLIKPETGVQPDPVHPYVLSISTYPGNGSWLVPIAAGLIAEPADLIM